MRCRTGKQKGPRCVIGKKSTMRCRFAAIRHAGGPEGVAAGQPVLLPDHASQGQKHPPSTSQEEGRQRRQPHRVHVSEVDWSKRESVIDAFATRIEDWYLQPCRAMHASSGHYAFPAMAINSLLIDTLSQFEAGQETSSRRTFI